MASEWITGVFTLGGTVIGGLLSSASGALTSRRQSADKRVELRQQAVKDSRDFVIAEMQKLVIVLDEFIRVVSEADDIDRARSQAIADDKHAEARYAAADLDAPWYVEPEFRQRPEFDVQFSEWRSRVTTALPSLRTAVNTVAIAIPEELASYAETFLRDAETLVKRFEVAGMFPVQSADVEKFTRTRKNLENAVRKWLYPLPPPS